MTGSNWERELIDRLAEDGWESMRAPASGGATKRELPDVIAGRPLSEVEPDAPSGTAVLAIEAKYRSDSPAYMVREDLEDLVTFSKAFGAKPLIATRWNGNKFGDTNWYFAPPGSIDTTETKGRLIYDECNTHWMTLDDLSQRYD